MDRNLDKGLKGWKYGSTKEGRAVRRDRWTDTTSTANVSSNINFDLLK